MPLLRMARRKYDVYDEVDGTRIGEAIVVKEGGKVVGYDVRASDGGSFFLSVEDVELLDNAIILTAKWMRDAKRTVERLRGFAARYPEIRTKRQAKKIVEVVSFQQELRKTLKILQEKLEEMKSSKEEILMDIAKLVGRRMLGEVDFATFSKEMERKERKYKILSRNISQCEKMIREIKESPFYIEEVLEETEKRKEEEEEEIPEIPPVPEVVRRSPPAPRETSVQEREKVVEKPVIARSSKARRKRIEVDKEEIDKEFKNIVALVDERGVLTVPAEDLKTIDEFMFDLDRKIKRKRFRK